MSSKTASHTVTFSENDQNALLVDVTGRMDFDSAASIIDLISRQINRINPRTLLLDISEVTYFDDYGALVVEELRERMGRTKGGLDLTDPAGLAGGVLSIADFQATTEEGLKEAPSLQEQVMALGDGALVALKTLVSMVSFLGAVIISFLRVFSNPKSFRMADTLIIMEKTGVQAIPIVALISFLLGLVMAFMSSLQLKQFGANIYVASLVSIAMVSELGPIMTAIVVAGRSGSAFAAEIGTMKISDEIDALTTMGFDPVTFLVVPRITAAVIVVPILTLLSNVFAIIGGLCIGVTLLNLTMTSYVKESMYILDFFEVSWGFMKSVVFSITIALVGCLRGFEAKGGADAVGNAATSAVVTSIFLIILFDSIFAVLRSYWW
jgi:phospholipid/cholesterol/gamma-HCH transport system permease protein